MRYESAGKPETCPRCGHTRIADVRYGLPDYSEDIYRQILNGIIVIGGAAAPLDAAAWQCTKCTLHMYKHTG